MFFKCIFKEVWVGCRKEDVIPLGKKRKGFVSGFVSVSDSVAAVYLMVAEEVVSFNSALKTRT